MSKNYKVASYKISSCKRVSWLLLILLSFSSLYANASTTDDLSSTAPSAAPSTAPSALVSDQASSLPNSPSPQLSPFVATYGVEKLGMTLGVTALELQLTPPNLYHYQLTTQTRGLARFFVKDSVVESSTGVFADTTIIPTSYHYSQTGGSKESLINTQISHSDNIAYIQGTEGKIDLEIPDNTVDRLGIHLAMMLYLQQHQLPAEFHLLDKTRVKKYSLIETGSEVLKTPVGSFATLIIQRTDEGGGRETKMWVAPELNYLPIRIRQDKHGSREFEMNLTSLQGLLTTKNALKEPAKASTITPEMVP